MALLTFFFHNNNNNNNNNNKERIGGHSISYIQQAWTNNATTIVDEVTLKKDIFFLCWIFLGSPVNDYYYFLLLDNLGLIKKKPQ